MYVINLGCGIFSIFKGAKLANSVFFQQFKRSYPYFEQKILQT